eukprot:9468466-Pyramimonas_sp.AAC.2
MTIRKRGEDDLRSYQDMTLIIKSRRRRVGSKKHVLSVRGGFTLAVKRNVGHAGAHAVLQHLEVPTSRWTLIRWELLSAAAVLGLSRAWHKTNYDYVAHMHRMRRVLPHEVRTFSYSVHSVRGDATNAKVGDSKAHVCEVSTLFEHLPLPPHLHHDDHPIRPVKAINCVYSDALRVPEHNGAAEQRALYLKQVRSVGARDWLHHPLHAGRDDLADWCPQDGDRSFVGNKYFHMSVWIFTTDQGGEQKAAARLIEADCRYMNLTLVFQQ